MVRMRRVWRMLIRWRWCLSCNWRRRRGCMERIRRWRSLSRIVRLWWWLEISSVWWRWRVRRGWVAGCSWVELCLVLWWRLHVCSEVGVVQVWVLIGWVHWVCWVWTCVVGSWVWLRFLRKHRQVKVFARIILVFIIINGLFFGLIVTIILLFLFNSCNKRGGGAVISGSERSIQSFISTFRKFLSCILRWFLSWRRGTLGWCWTCFWIIVTSKTFLKESTGQVHK